MIERLAVIVRKILPKNKFARGVGVLVGGTAGAQVLMILASPVLTRLYTPDDFGLLAVYMGLLALFTVVASFMYELAIPLPETHKEAANILVLSLLIVLSTTAVSAALILIIGEQIANQLDAPKLANYLWLLPVGVFLSGCYKVFNYWAIRTKSFSSIAKTRVSQSLATIAVQLLGFKLGGAALLLGQAGGQGVGSVRLAKSALRHPEFRRWQWAGVWHAAKRYKRFPIYSTWSGFANTAGVQLPPLLFASLFSAGAAGLYALAHRVLSLPMSLIGQAVGQVFFSGAAEAHREGRLGTLVISLHSRLSAIAMPPALILVIAGPELFRMVFGESWYQAGVFARWMAPWLYFVFATSPLSTLFSVIEKQGSGLVFQLVLLTTRVGSMIIGAHTGNLLLTIILFSSVSALCWIGFMFWIGYHAGKCSLFLLRTTCKDILKSLLFTAPLFLGVGLFGFNGYQWLIALAATLFIICVHYFFILKKAY